MGTGPIADSDKLNVQISCDQSIGRGDQSLRRSYSRSQSRGRSQSRSYSRSRSHSHSRSRDRDTDSSDDDRSEEEDNDSDDDNSDDDNSRTTTTRTATRRSIRARARINQSQPLNLSSINLNHLVRSSWVGCVPRLCSTVCCVVCGMSVRFCPTFVYVRVPRPCCVPRL